MFGARLTSLVAVSGVGSDSGDDGSLCLTQFYKPGASSFPSDSPGEIITFPVMFCNALRDCLKVVTDKMSKLSQSDPGILQLGGINRT